MNFLVGFTCILTLALTTALLAIRDRQKAAGKGIQEFTARAPISENQFVRAFPDENPVTLVISIRDAVATLARVDASRIGPYDRILARDQCVPYWDDPDWWSFDAALEECTGSGFADGELHKIRRAIEAKEQPIVADLVKAVVREVTISRRVAARLRSVLD